MFQSLPTEIDNGYGFYMSRYTNFIRKYRFFAISGRLDILKNKSSNQEIIINKKMLESKYNFDLNRLVPETPDKPDNLFFQIWYRSFPDSADRNGHPIWILQVKINVLIEAPFLDNIKVM